jgi:hypothetical protein
MAGRAPVVAGRNKAEATPKEQEIRLITEEGLQERIRNRAHEIYLVRSGEGGAALDDWLQAEREILTQERSGE